MSGNYDQYKALIEKEAVSGAELMAALDAKSFIVKKGNTAWYVSIGADGKHVVHTDKTTVRQAQAALAVLGK